MMLRRVTIMLDDDLLRKLRTRQAKEIKNNQGSVSLSRVINDYLRTNLKNGKV
jgi:flagellar basal body-associated protein FliL